MHINSFDSGNISATPGTQGGASASHSNELAPGPNATTVEKQLAQTSRGNGEGGFYSPPGGGCITHADDSVLPRGVLKFNEQQRVLVSSESDGIFKTGIKASLNSHNLSKTHAFTFDQLRPDSLSKLDIQSRLDLHGHGGVRDLNCLNATELAKALADAGLKEIGVIKLYSCDAGKETFLADLRDALTDKGVTVGYLSGFKGKYSDVRLPVKLGSAKFNVNPLGLFGVANQVAGPGVLFVPARWMTKVVKGNVDVRFPGTRYDKPPEPNVDYDGPLQLDRPRTPPPSTTRLKTHEDLRTAVSDTPFIKSRKALADDVKAFVSEGLLDAKRIGKTPLIIVGEAPNSQPCMMAEMAAMKAVHDSGARATFMLAPRPKLPGLTGDLENDVLNYFDQKIPQALNSQTAPMADSRLDSQFGSSDENKKELAHVCAKAYAAHKLGFDLRNIAAFPGADLRLSEVWMVHAIRYQVHKSTNPVVVAADRDHLIHLKEQLEDDAYIIPLALVSKTIHSAHLEEQIRERNCKLMDDGAVMRFRPPAMMDVESCGLLQFASQIGIDLSKPRTR